MPDASSVVCNPLPPNRRPPDSDNLFLLMCLEPVMNLGTGTAVVLPACREDLLHLRTGVRDRR